MRAGFDINDTPGAGTYKMPVSSGKQVDSTRRSNPAFGFGSATRPDLNDGLVG